MRRRNFLPPTREEISMGRHDVLREQYFTKETRHVARQREDDSSVKRRGGGRGEKGRDRRGTSRDGKPNAIAGEEGGRRRLWRSPRDRRRD